MASWYLFTDEMYATLYLLITAFPPIGDKIDLV